MLKIPKAVWFLGAASLLTDLAGDAIYPLLPIFLTEVIGASVLFVGTFEGVAESSASLSKYFAGYISDKVRRRSPFVLFGYGLSNLIRPLIGLITLPWQALVLRFIDRVGKGVRGAPRDAWLATYTTSKTRGWIFGFHRGMDNMGAILGPLLAALFLSLYPGAFRPLFILTIIPGLLSVVAILAATKTPKGVAETIAGPELVKTKVATRLPKHFLFYLSILGIFTLATSSDAFILLKLKNSGIPVSLIPLLWAALHVVKTTTSLLGGRLSDIFGRKFSIISGWILYSIVYLVFAFTSSPALLIPVFITYGLFYGLTEGPERAFVADLIEPHTHGTAFGLYHLVTGILAFPASFLFGWIWESYGAGNAFLIDSIIAAVAVLFLCFLKVPRLRDSSVIPAKAGI